MNGSSVGGHLPEPHHHPLSHPLPASLPQHQYKNRARIDLPGPPGGLEKNLDRGPLSPPVLSAEPPKKEKKVSKIMRLPLPKIDSEENGEKSAKKTIKPSVIDKIPVGPMTDDGRDWGERCVDMYKIVDKVASAAAT